MKAPVKSSLALVAVLHLSFAGRSTAAYAGWKHAGSVFVLTTRDGADLPAAASVVNFPLLVRLHKDSESTTSNGKCRMMPGLVLVDFWAESRRDLRSTERRFPR